jgi:protein transport protein SEC13
VEGESHQLTETLKGYDALLDPYLQPPFSDLPPFTDLTLSSDNRLTDIPNHSHDGAVWSLSWAHPKFGTLLASCSYSGQILIWRESPPGSWTQVYSSTTHTASVNIVAWAPHELGCILAAASSDGTVSVIELASGAAGAAGQNNTAPSFHQIAHFPAHPLGANSVSWAPSLAAGSLTGSAPAAQQQQSAVRRFVTGGSDCLVKIWELQGGNSSGGGGAPAEAVCVHTLAGHQDWVRDVAWSSTVLRKSYIASASQDKTVRIWTSENGSKFQSPRSVLQ